MRLPELRRTNRSLKHSRPGRVLLPAGRWERIIPHAYKEIKRGQSQALRKEVPTGRRSKTLKKKNEGRGRVGKLLRHRLPKGLQIGKR